MHRTLSAAAILALSIVPAVHAEFKTIYGGPARDESTDTTYRSTGVVVGDGFAFAIADDSSTNFSAGIAFRFDSSGAPPVQLGDLGYTPPDLPIPSILATVNAANSSGTAVGYGEKGTQFSNFRAIRWDASTNAAVELGTLGTTNLGTTSAYAVDINDAGTAVGSARKHVGGSGLRAVRWEASTTAAIELGNLGTNLTNATTSQARAINAGGTVVGYAHKYNGNTDLGQRAVRWNAGTTVATELDALGAEPDGWTNSEAIDINTSGTAVGYAGKYEAAGTNRGERAVRWQANSTVAEELGTLSPTSFGFNTSRATAINDAGTVIGSSDKWENDVNLGTRAVRWDAASTAAVELANFGVGADGRTNSIARAINASGFIVGTARVHTATASNPLAVLWNPDGSIVDLNSFVDPASGWSFQDAYDISDTNWVTGVGVYDEPGSAGPYSRAFMIQIPEPATLGTLAFGTLFLRRRRRA